MPAKPVDLTALVKDVPDFPKKGIIFKDITPLLADPRALQNMVDQLAEPYLQAGIQYVAGIESRGFLIAAPLACRLKAGLVPIRKKGKLPRKTKSATYNLEYGQDSIEAHEDAFPPGARVLLVDDVLATGGTAQAACELIEKIGGIVAGVSFLIELGFLNGRSKLTGRAVKALIKY